MKKRVLSFSIVLIIICTLFSAFFLKAQAADTYFTAVYSSGLEFANLSNEQVKVYCDDLYSTYEYASYYTSGEVISGTKSSSVAMSYFTLQAGQRYIISSTSKNSSVKFYLQSANSKVTVNITDKANVHFTATYPNGVEFSNLTNKQMKISCSDIYGTYNFTRYTITGEVIKGTKLSSLATSEFIINAGEKYIITPVTEGKTVEFYYATELDNIKIKCKDLSATSAGCKNGHTYKSANGNKCTVCGYEFTPEMKDVNKTFYAIKANVPVWSSPYSKSGTVVKQMKADESVYITKSLVNSVGNLWYLTQDGKYIYSENLTDKKPINVKNYNASSAVSFAKNNYSTSSEKCAGFVSKSLTAGGFNIMNRVVSDLYWTLKDEGFESYSLTPNGNYYYISEGNNSKAKVGDVIIYYCNACTNKNYKHAVIITEIDSKGIIHATGTNARWDNEINCAGYRSSCSHGRANEGSYTVYLLHWPY